MPSRFLQAIGVESVTSDSDREPRGRAGRERRRTTHSSSTRLLSAKERVRDGRKSTRSYRSAPSSGTESRSSKHSSVRSNSGKERVTKSMSEKKHRPSRLRHEDSSAYSSATEGEGKEGLKLLTDDDHGCRTEPLPSDAIASSPLKQQVDVFAFQDDWSDDEADKRTIRPEPIHQEQPISSEDTTDSAEVPSEQAIRTPKEEPAAHVVEEPPGDIEFEPSWLPATAEEAEETDDVPTPMPRDFLPSRTISAGSTLTTNPDPFSEQPTDGETDRSTSPDMSMKSPASPEASAKELSHQKITNSIHNEPAVPGTLAGAKVAAQILSSEQRQRQARRRSSNHKGRPEMRHRASQELSYQPQPAYPLYPPAQQIQAYPQPPQVYPPQPQILVPQLPLDVQGHPPPVTGYAAVASALSSSSFSHLNPASAVFQPSNPVPPLYRRFSTLNHRLMIYLQDELSQLEEELEYLDACDTASRTHPSSVSGRLVIRPASRREGALASTGSLGPQAADLEWRRTELMSRLASKIKTYNEALASFQSTAALPRPNEGDITTYEDYLTQRRPIVGEEAAFLEHTEDLVCLEQPRKTVISSRHSSAEYCIEHRQQRRLTATAHEESPKHRSSSTIRHPYRQSHHQVLLLAALIAVILPMLAFRFVPNFTGRMFVAAIIALGLYGTLAQGGAMRAVRVTAKAKMAISGAWLCGMAVLALVS